MPKSCLLKSASSNLACSIVSLSNLIKIKLNFNNSAITINKNEPIKDTYCVYEYRLNSILKILLPLIFPKNLKPIILYHLTTLKSIIFLSNSRNLSIRFPFLVIYTAKFASSRVYRSFRLARWDLLRRIMYNSILNRETRSSSQRK